MVEYEQPKSAAEFLSIWYPLAQAHNTTGLEALEKHLPAMAETDPAMALEILRDLAASDTYSAKEAAAIYARDVFEEPQRAETTELLPGLFQTDDTHIRGKVLDSIDALTSDPGKLNPAEAADLITAINTAGNAAK
jgi:hypothetical protein